MEPIANGSCKAQADSGANHKKKKKNHGKESEIEAKHEGVV